MSRTSCRSSAREYGAVWRLTRTDLRIAVIAETTAAGGAPCQ
jgi:hypothetical protein